MSEKCEFIDSCKYGSQGSCDFIGIEKRSRVKNDPKGKIVGGKCGYYEDWSNERTRLRAKDRWDSFF